MAEQLCDICQRRPATTRVTVLENGRRKNMDVCDYDYARLTRHQQYISPLESLFRGNSLFDDFFSDRRSNSDLMSDTLTKRRSIGDRETVNLDAYLSEQTKEFLQRAAEQAVNFGKREVDTEHLLYALTDSEVVQAILKQFKLSPEDLQGLIDQNATRGDLDEQEEKQIDVGVSPRVKSVLERAFAASRDLGHSYVGPEHLLIGLAEVPDSFAGTLLQKYSLTPAALRQQTVKVIGKGAEEGRVDAPSNTPQLDKYSRDLTALARQGKLDPVIGRSQEIETTIEVLARRKKNNPVLIGEPGVGKTAIVEGLAQRVVNEEVPNVLRDKRLVELNINSLVAGSKYRGEFEERVQQVLNEVTQHQDEIVLFIDEIHTIVGAGQGGGEGGLDIANVFKPAKSAW